MSTIILPLHSEGGSSHYTYCGKDVTVCDVCGATGLNPDSITINHIVGEYIDLGTQCQPKCGYCDYKYQPRYHWGGCYDPDYCYGCSLDGVIILPEYLQHDYTYVNQGKQHIGLCDDCDNRIVENHQIMCDEPNECLLGCRQFVTEVDPDCINHWSSNLYHERTVTEHVLNCRACDKRWEPIKHFKTCDETGVCAECRMGTWGGAIISRTVHRAKEGTITYTAERHSFECVDCGEYVKSQPHFYWYSDECDECGYVYGSLPPSPVLPGDPTGDGFVDIFDALAVLQCAVGWDSDIDQEAGDVNDDGYCDIFDALLILQYSVGWDVELK